MIAATEVDAINAPDGVVLLPIDPGASTGALCATLRERTSLRLGVLTDTAGPSWREGQTEIAIGSARLSVLDERRGTTEASGRPFDVMVAAVADLVKGKTSGNPVAVVRGLDQLVGDPDVRDARGASRRRPASENDMFRLGTAEACAEDVAAWRASALADAAGCDGSSPAEPA